MNTDEYKQYLKAKLEIIQRISDNALAQCQAVKSNDMDLLGKLLKRQQANIDKMKRIGKYCSLSHSFINSAELEKSENFIDSMLETVIQASISNISNVEKLKNEIGNSICNLKVNRNAIRNGYFKKSDQQFGYFIDKKVGR